MLIIVKRIINYQSHHRKLTHKMKTSYKLTILTLLIVIFCSCSQSKVDSMEEKYDLSIQYMDKGDQALAIPLLQEIINENPGTRYAAYSYLKLGDAYLSPGQAKFEEAETNYRIFLNYSSHSHLVPYVLGRLIELNYKKNTSSLFGNEYSFSRDPDHFKKIIVEYQRFYFLFPDSLYLQDAKEYLGKSKEALAEHELLIGNWYFDHSLYTAAISRYSYLLQNYPNFRKRNKIVEKLINTYQRNQQPEMAQELNRVFIQTKN